MSGDGLGAGEGKWQLSVTTEQSIQVMSVLKTPEHLTNLSTVRYAGFAPPDEGRVQRPLCRKAGAGDGRIGLRGLRLLRKLQVSPTAGGMYEGSYTYENEGPNSGTLVFDYEDGEKCTALAAFDSFIAGTTLSVCEDGGVFELQPIRSWVLEDIGPAGMAPADQAAFDALVDSRRLAHDDASGLGVAFVFVSPGEFSQAPAPVSEREPMRTRTPAGARGRWSSPTRAAARAPSTSCSRRTTRAAWSTPASTRRTTTTTGSTNWRLEFAGAAGLAPADQDAFYERFRDKRLVSTAGHPGFVLLPRFPHPDGFREYEFGDTYEGTYTYVSTGANTADLVLEYDDGDRCDDVDITFRIGDFGPFRVEVCRSEGTEHG